ILFRKHTSFRTKATCIDEAGCRKNDTIPTRTGTMENAMNRRQTLKLLAGAAAFAGSATTIGRAAFAQAKPAFVLPPLGYPYEALEPHIDTATMNFHHKNHHNAFITNLNGLVE